NDGDTVGNFTYSVNDNSGADNATTDGKVIINVTPVNDVPNAQDDYGNTGLDALNGKYFAYEEGNGNPNLSTIAQVVAIAENNEPDAVFNATTIYYGSGNGDLGRDNDPNDGQTNLELFLGTDADSLVVNTPTDTQDAVVSMDGLIELEAGTYNFKVMSDDGYIIKIDGEIVASVNFNQAPRETTHAAFEIGTAGLHSIEIVYWDQSGQYVFKPQLSKDGGEYQQLSTYNLSNGYNTAEDTPISFDPTELFANDSDPENDSLSLSTDAAHPAVSHAVNGTVTVVDGKIVFTPDDNYYGPAQFDYTVTDGNGGYDTATVYLTVTPVDDGPISPITDIDSTTNTVSELASIGDGTGVHADATSPNGGDITYSLNDTANGRFAIDSSTGEITVNEDFDQADVGDHTVTVKAVAQDGTSSVENFIISITENNAPIVQAASFTEQGDTGVINFNLSDYVTDVEDDADSSKITSIVIQSLPDASAGTLVKVNGDGTTTPVTQGEVLPESTALRYIENTSPIVDASFNAVTDFEPAHGTNAVSSFTSSTGIELTGGTFSGATPTSGLTAGTLNYDTSGGDTDGNAIGVNGGELEGSASSNEYISAKFTAADVTNVTLGLSSVGSHFSTNSGAVNAVVKAVLFKDGVQVGEIQSFENLHNLASETNQPTITIDSSQEFDELRLFMTSTSSTSSMLLRSIDVNHPPSEDTFTFSAIDANGKVSDETATVTFNMTSDAINAIDDQRSNVIGSEVLEQTGSDIIELGSTTQSTTPAPATQQREFNFGVENANKVMTLSFDALVKGSWDDIVVDNVTADSFSISANGSLQETHTYSSYESDPNNVSYDDSWEHDDGTHEYQVTLDEFGRAVIDFSVISTRDKETVTITNIEASLTRIATDDMLIDVLRNDETLDQDVTLSLPSNNVSVDGTVVGTLSIIDNKVLFSPNEQILTLSQAQLDQLSFDYTISDGESSDTATVKLDMRVADASSAQTVGSSLNDQIVVNQGEWAASEQTRLTVSYVGTDGQYTPYLGTETVAPGTSYNGQSYSPTSAQTVDSGAGNDHVETAAGNDVIFAGDSTTLLDIEVEIATGLHGLLTDELSTIAQDNTALLRQDLVSNPQLDIVNSGSGDDIIYGQAGSDLLYGHTGNDYIDGGIGNDGLRGGLGNDTLLGQDGNDWLVGDDGNDTLIGGDGNDTIIAGLGDDIIIGGLGNDVM
ncbi:MAG: Ig-like domain-containing protein, partial [Psychrobium sp.]